MSEQGLELFERLPSEVPDHADLVPASAQLPDGLDPELGEAPLASLGLVVVRELVPGCFASVETGLHQDQDQESPWGSLKLPMQQLLTWAQVPKARFYEWRERYGKANVHNGMPGIAGIVPSKQQGRARARRFVISEAATEAGLSEHAEASASAPATHIAALREDAGVP